jgi:hypothetical protein
MIASQNLYIIQTVFNDFGEPAIGLTINYSIKTSEGIEVYTGTLTEIEDGKYELKKTLNEGQYRISYACEGYQCTDDVVECYNISQMEEYTSLIKDNTLQIIEDTQQIIQNTTLIKNDTTQIKTDTTQINDIVVDNLDTTISSRASQQSLDDKKSQYISTVTVGIDKKIYYSEEKISVIRNDTNIIMFNFKDQYGILFIPDPLRTYLFAVKRNINDTDYIVEPKVLEIVDNKLILTLEKEDVPETVLAQWEVVEVENYGQENEKEHTLHQGIFEVKGDIIRR